MVDRIRPHHFDALALENLNEVLELLVGLVVDPLGLAPFRPRDQPGEVRVVDLGVESRLDRGEAGVQRASHAHLFEPANKQQ